ncbi:lasso RiPP family leader peptide-containing protein [Parasphingorhabdus sp.]
MKNEATEQGQTKGAYEKPELEDHGSLAEHTQSFTSGGSGTDFGSS